MTDGVVSVLCMDMHGYLFTISGSWSISWNVFSTKPFVDSENAFEQYSHWNIRYGNSTVLIIGR